MSATKVMEAVKAGDGDELRRLLEGDPAAGATQAETGESPLLAALYQGRRDLADLILEFGAEPTPSESAALGDTGRLRASLDAAPGVVVRHTADGWTPLHLAAFFGHADAVGLLLERGADPNLLSTNPMRNTPLHAALAGVLGVDGVRLLLDAGAEANARQHGGFTPLHSAASRGSALLVQLLLGCGADPEATADDGRRPVDFARERGHAEVVALFPERGTALRAPSGC